MVRAMRRSRDDVVDLLRSTGALLLAIGAVVLLIRKSGKGEWTDFELMLVVLVPAVVLYALAIGAPSRTPAEKAEPSTSVLMTASILLAPLALYSFLKWSGASSRHVLYNAAVFAVTGLLAAYGARRARAPYAALLAGLSLLVAWLLVWAKILTHPSANTFRWLLIAGAALLLAAAARLARSRAIGAGEVATAGGLAAVAAGVFGVIVGAFVAAFRGISSLLGPGGTVPSARGSVATIPRHKRAHVETLDLHTTGLQHFGWDLYLLVMAIVLIWIGSRARIRGLGYVGGIGLAAFAISVGTQLTRLESGHGPTHALAGWPLALLILGVAGLAAPLLYRRRD
jgi:hypothetical protein